MAKLNLGIEPTLILQTIAAVLGLIVTLNVGMTEEQAGLVVAFISSVIAVVNALAVRPIAPAVFTGAVAAAAALLGAYGYDFSPATIGAVNAVVVAVLGLIFRDQVTPVARGVAA